MIFYHSDFIVKAILGIAEVQNLPFQHILGLWVLIFYKFWHFLKAAIYQIYEIQST